MIYGPWMSMGSPAARENFNFSWHYKKDTVDRLYNYLTSKGHKIWKDDEGGLQGHLVDGMADAIERSKVILVCLSEKYFSSKNCKLELEYAHEMEKQIVVIKLDPLLKLTGHGALSMILAKQLYLENDDEEVLFQAVHHRLAGNSSKAISVPTAMKPLNFANLKNFETSTDYKYIVAYDNLPQYKTISFECEISNDIHIGIAKSPRHKDPKYEIVIGGWRGTKSVIRDRNQGENLISTVHEYPFFVQLRKKVKIR